MVAIMTCGTAGGTAGQIAEKRVTLVKTLNPNWEVLSIFVTNETP